MFSAPGYDAVSVPVTVPAGTAALVSTTLTRNLAAFGAPAAAAQTPEPPGFVFPQRGKTTVKFKVVCAEVCDVTAQLTVDRPTAKKLGLGKDLTAGSLTQQGVAAGRTELTLRLKSKAKKALQKGPKSLTYRARIKAAANYAGTAPVSRSAQVTLKR